MEKIAILKKLKQILSKNSKTNNYHEDFISTKDITKMYGYTGFIDPCGTFYICSSIELGEEIHAPWAYLYLKQEKGEKVPMEEAVVHLIEKYNYVLFAGVRDKNGQMIIINAPEDPNTYTKEQQQVYNALCAYYQKTNNHTK